MEYGVWSSVGQRRLANQRIGQRESIEPHEVVGWMGAVQAQDYLGALWAVGVRVPGATEAGIELALAERRIVRTWPLRGTLHFVAAADVRWILALAAPRAMAQAAGRLRQLELDQATLDRSRNLLTAALQGGRELTRAAIYERLESGGVSTAGQRGIHIIGRLAQDGLICFGPRDGKQPTFVLLEEWVPAAKMLPREEALAELVRRYVTSHGPATLQDFVWWSGLTTADARAGLELARAHVVQEMIAGQAYWRPASGPIADSPSPAAHLLPAFDEYLVGYQDRRAVLDPQMVKRINAGGGMLSPTIVFDGQVVGTWKRTLKQDRVTIVPTWFSPPTDPQIHALDLAAQRYAAFLNRHALLNH